MAALKSSIPQTLSKREYDPEIKDMANYIHNTPIDSELAVGFNNPIFGELNLTKLCIVRHCSLGFRRHSGLRS